MIQISMYTIGLYSCYYYGFPPASAIVTSAEMARVTMKVHAYFREKIINGVNKDGYYATFIPDWAIKAGITIEDLDQPKIEVSGKILVNTSLLCRYHHGSQTLLLFLCLSHTNLQR